MIQGVFNYIKCNTSEKRKLRDSNNFVQLQVPVIKL